MCCRRAGGSQRGEQGRRMGWCGWWAGRMMGTCRETGMGREGMLGWWEDEDENEGPMHQGSV